MSKTTINWRKQDDALLMEAVVNGIVDFSMGGKELVMALYQYKQYQHFHDLYSNKQVKNALDRIKKKATPTEGKIDELNESLTIQNELQEKNGKFLLLLIIIVYLTNMFFYYSIMVDC